MLTDPLWGGTLDHLAFDACAQIVTISVQVTAGELSTRHELRLSGVTDFQFLNAIPGPWEYVELTELHFDRDASLDSWRFTVLLWSDDSSLTGRCAGVTVNGVDLA